MNFIQIRDKGLFLNRMIIDNIRRSNFRRTLRDNHYYRNNKTSQFEMKFRYQSEYLKYYYNCITN